MHVQNMGLRTLNMSRGVQQKLTNLEYMFMEADIGETVVQNVHLNQVTIQYLFASYCNHCNAIFTMNNFQRIVHPHVN